MKIRTRIITDKIDFKSKKFMRAKQEHYIE
jgi:hypothetical protein